MRIEFVRQYGVHRPGSAFDHPLPGVADALIRRGVAVPAGKAGEPAGDPEPAKRPAVKKPRGA